MIAADKFTLTICALFCAMPLFFILVFAVGMNAMQDVANKFYFVKLRYSKKKNPSPTPTNTPKKG